MLNKAFLRLTDAERIKKLDIVIRNRTDNLTNAEQIKALLNGAYLPNQCRIAIHPDKRDECEALINDNVLHIYIPEKSKTNEGE